MKKRRPTLAVFAKTKPNKYGAKKTKVNGTTFDSKKEAARYQELKLLERDGKITDLQTQVSFELIPQQKDSKGETIRRTTYVADFVYTDVAKGKQVVEDVKGHKTEVYKIKRKLMKLMHGIEVREV